MSRDQREQSDFTADTATENLDAPLAPSPSTDLPPGSYPFEAMSLKAGDRLQAQPPAKLSTERCFVRLIGYMQGQSLLVTAPKTLTGVPLQLIEGDKLVMRVFSSQNAFGFACDVLRLCKLPYTYLHLSFPHHVQGTLIRKAPRVKTRITARIRAPKDSGTEMTGVLSNLSAHGALLDSRRHLAGVGEQLSLSFRFRLHNVETDLSLRAVVRAVSESDAPRPGESPISHFGLEFVDLQPNDQMLLQSMVYQKMIEDPQSLV